MRKVALILAALLVLSLTACNTPARDNNALNPGNNNNNDTLNPGDDDNLNPNDDTDDDILNPDDDDDLLNPDDDDILDPDDDNKTPGDTDNNNANGDRDDVDDRRIAYNGHVYEVTDDIISADDVGVELFSIMDTVTGDPVNEGEALGIDEGTKVYRIKNDNEYNIIAVEIENIFYKAVRDV